MSPVELQGIPKEALGVPQGVLRMSRNIRTVMSRTFVPPCDVESCLFGWRVAEFQGNLLRRLLLLGKLLGACQKVRSGGRGESSDLIPCSKRVVEGQWIHFRGGLDNCH